VLNPFIEWSAEVASDPVVVRPDNIRAEAKGNLWSFSLSPEQAAAVTVATVLRFAEQVILARRAWLTARNAGEMVLYWWHDAQAGQLRFSMVSAVHGALPFGCKTTQASSHESVIEDWLRSSYLHGIPFSELEPSAADDVEPTLAPLSVWSQTVP
jgi:hypothetical protein